MLKIIWYSEKMQFLQFMLCISVIGESRKQLQWDNTHGGLVSQFAVPFYGQLCELKKRKTEAMQGSP